MKKNLKMMLMLLSVFSLSAVLCSASLGQDDRGDRDVSKEAAVPEADQAYSKETPKLGLAASAADLVVIARGGWALQFTVDKTSPAVFEYGAKGYGEPGYKIKYLGTTGSGSNLFLHYKVEGWKIEMAIRNESINGTFPMSFRLNNAGPFNPYANGVAYPVAQ